MRPIKQILLIAFLAVLSVNAQEKKIQFNKGTLKICSSKNFTIEGYDGKEVIIKSENHVRQGGYSIATNNNGFIYRSSRDTSKISTITSINSTKRNNIYSTNFPKVAGTTNNVFFSTSVDQSKKEGLKRLGKKQENKELGIYFIIEQNDGELIFKDNTEGQFAMFGNENYTIKIPNSIKLKWDTSACVKSNANSPMFYSNKISSLTNFNGEVEISTSLNNLKLTDVTGPVSINSIGGNVTVDFDKKTPLKLYSVYTNNGFIDITMPSNSDVDVEANGTAIYSDLDFNVISDNESDGQQHMKLKLKGGKVKMKLEAGYGTIYLRKK